MNNIDEERRLAYGAGYDCGVNGPNEINCHFSLFSTPAKTMAWEKGKSDAKRSTGPPDGGGASKE